jgi:hypothetical protein
VLKKRQQMNWYKFSFSAAEAAQGAHAKAQDEFTAIFTALRAPQNLSLFSAWESKADILSLFICIPQSCEASLKTFLSKYSASSTSRPQNYDKIGLLVGHADAINLLK